MKRTILFSVALFFSFTLFHCIEQETISDDDMQDGTGEVENTYCEVDEVEEIHQFAVSPCPQTVGVFTIVCDPEAGNGVADSLSVKAGDSRIACYLGTEKVQDLDVTGRTDVSCQVDFTCADDQSFEHPIVVECYENDVLIAEEQVKVKITVQK